MKFFKNVVLLLSVLLLVVACGDEQTATPVSPTATSPVTTAVTSVTNPPPNTAVAATATGEVDPVRPLPTVATVAPDTGGPVVAISPTPTPVYAPLVNPPRGLTPTPITPTDSLDPLPKGSFVIASRTGLFLLSADGKDDHTITAGAAFSDPKVSPDGLRVAVFREDPITLQKKLVLVTGAGKISPLPDNGGNVLFATWSPDSKSLALTRATDTNNDGLIDDYDAPTIWIYDLAGNKQRLLTDGRNPNWSSDGIRLIFTVPGAFSDEIDPATRKPKRAPNSLAVYNLQSNARRVLLDTKKLDITLPASLGGQVTTARNFQEVTWHPDNKRITASLDSTLKNGSYLGLVVTITLEDVAPKVISAGGDAAAGVEWSPDGNRLAFEVEPRFPVNAGSAYRIGLGELPGSGDPQPVKTFLGNPANRAETRRPHWLTNNNLAYLETGVGILTLYNLDTTTAKGLITGCTGFDVV